jgi:hypothetical protein
MKVLIISRELRETIEIYQAISDFWSHSEILKGEPMFVYIDHGLSNEPTAVKILIENPNPDNMTSYLLRKHLLEKFPYLSGIRTLTLEKFVP